MDPVVAALAGAVTTLAGIVYRLLIARAEKAEKSAATWEERYFRQIGMTDLALDEAEKRREP